MTSDARLGVLGGTLDPVHTGHIDVAVAARRALALDRVVLLPTRIPPHRPSLPSASPFHRFAMAALAVSEVDGLEVSDLELSAPGTSYTADTLDRLHASGLRPAQIFFITGADAFAEIATWHRYPDVLDQAHFVVVSRPGFPAPGLPGLLPMLASRMRQGLEGETTTATTAIFLLDTRTADVSSTEIRRRVRTGESVADLVPPLVERHIVRHRLYSREGVPRGVATAADQLHGKN